MALIAPTMTPETRKPFGRGKGGCRERAGRPPLPYTAVTIKLRRCRACGRFVSFSHDHRCPYRKERE